MARDKQFQNTYKGRVNYCCPLRTKLMVPAKNPEPRNFTISLFIHPVWSLGLTRKEKWAPDYCSMVWQFLMIKVSSEEAVLVKSRLCV